MERLYIDTNVIVDAVEDRCNIFGKNIGTSASNLFLKSLSGKYQLIISTWTLTELKCSMKVENSSFFDMFKKCIKYVNYTEEEKERAEERSKDNNDDALHIIIAERENADYIITMNRTHFLQIGTKIPIRKPQELL